MNTRNLLVSVLMLVSVLLSACAPAATQAPTVILPTTAPTVAPTQEPTIFSPKIFELPISANFNPSEWYVLEEYPDVITLVNKEYDVDTAFLIVKNARIARPEAPFTGMPFPDDFVTWIQSHGLFQIVKTQPIVLGGFQGTQIDADATPACKTRTAWIFFQSTHWNCSAGGRFHFVYLNNVYGEPLLIMNTGSELQSAEDFKLAVETSQKVLDTAVFSEPLSAAP